MRKKATIKDIAKIAGVSPTAVSAALSGSARVRISKETCERIFEVANELRYQPNLVARSLVSKRSKLLGLLITTILNPGYPELARGVEEAALGSGYNILLASTNYDRQLEESCITSLIARGVDGLIISSIEYDGHNIRELLRDGFPFVLVNRTVDPSLFDKPIDHVVGDNFRGGYMVAEHLHCLGHKMIGHITGALNTSTGKLRTQGFRKALSDLGLKPDPALVYKCNFDPVLAYNATKKLLSRKRRPTAMFAQTDYMALAVRDAILNAGMKIPEDIALVGFDNIAVSALKGIELTSIDWKKYEMGAIAVKILIEKIEGKTPPLSNQITLEPELIIRESCGYKRFKTAESGS